MGGSWCLDNTRIPLKVVLFMLGKGGYTLKDIYKHYPWLEKGILK